MLSTMSEDDGEEVFKAITLSMVNASEQEVLRALNTSFARIGEEIVKKVLDAHEGEFSAAYGTLGSLCTQLCISDEGTERAVERAAECDEGTGEFIYVTIPPDIKGGPCILSAIFPEGHRRAGQRVDIWRDPSWQAGQVVAVDTRTAISAPGGHMAEVASPRPFNQNEFYVMVPRLSDGVHTLSTIAPEEHPMAGERLTFHPDPTWIQVQLVRMDSGKAISQSQSSDITSSTRATHPKVLPDPGSVTKRARKRRTSPPHKVESTDGKSEDSENSKVGKSEDGKDSKDGEDSKSEDSKSEDSKVA